MLIVDTTINCMSVTFGFEATRQILSNIVMEVILMEKHTGRTISKLMALLAIGSYHSKISKAGLLTEQIFERWSNSGEEQFG